MGTSVSVKSLSKLEMAQGPGSLALDEKLSTKKYENAYAGESSTEQMMLPLKDMLHELASLKVLNPEMASEALVPPGGKIPRTDLMTTHSIKPTKRSRKISGKIQNNNANSEGASVASNSTFMKAGAASLASSSSSSSRKKLMAAGDDTASEMTEIDMPQKDPMMGEIKAIGGGAKSSHQVIKEKGRIMEYKTIRSRKKKVVDR